jgi:N-acetyl sugar amidotransferase
MSAKHTDPRLDEPNYEDYLPDVAEPKTFYGLPRNIEFCQSCVISNQRPNSAVEYEHKKETKKKTILIGSDGICDACRQSARKEEEIDWEQRAHELRVLCDAHRSQNGSYDCIVPGSGGKDSFYQSWLLKYEYGMNPLTITWAPNIYTDWGWRNFNRWIHSGFDNQLITPNGRVKRLLTRLSVENIFHPFQSFMIGQKAIAPKIALSMGIPLIFYGENEAEYGNPIADNSTAKRDYTYFTQTDKENIFLSGCSVQSLVDDYGISQADLQVYLPGDPVEIEKAKIEVHYLGYYKKWHPQSAYYFSVENGGFEASPERTPGTYSKYNSIDDRIDDLHYFTTFTKFGIGRATYDAAQEVRSGDLTREEGVLLVKRYDGEFPERFAKELFTYLSLPEKEFPIASRQFEAPVMDREYFDALTNRFRSPHLWTYEDGVWKPRRQVFGAN